MEDVGELDRDIAAADNGDAFGQLLQMERFVRGDAEFGALESPDARRVAAGGDQDGLRR